MINFAMDAMLSLLLFCVATTIASIEEVFPDCSIQYINEDDATQQDSDLTERGMQDMEGLPQLHLHNQVVQ